MAIGEILRLNTEQGIGYIRQADEDEELSFTAMALVDDIFDHLRAGQKVEFERKAYAGAPNKHRAIKVRVASNPS